MEEEEEEADDERDHAKPSFKRQAKRARHKADAAPATASTMIPSITTLLPSATSSLRKRTRSESPSSGSNSDSEREVENSIIVGLPNGFSPLTPRHYRAQDARLGDARRKRARVDSGSYNKGADVEEGDSESIPLYVSSDDGDTADGPSIQSQSQSFHTHQPQSQSRPRTGYVAKPHPFGGREPAMLFINGRDIVPGIIESNRQHFYADLEKDWRNHTNAPEGAIPPWVVPDAEGSGVDRDQEDEDEDDVRPVAWNDYEVNEEEEDVEMGEDEVSEDELEDDIIVGDVGNLAEENDHGESGRRSDVVRDEFLANGYVRRSAHSAWFADPSSLLHQNTRHRSQAHPHSDQTQSQASTSQSHTQSQSSSSQSQSQSQAGPSQPRRRARPLTRARERIRINAAGQYETYLYDETPEYRARLQREKKMFEEWRNYRPEPDDSFWQQVSSKIRQLSEIAPPVLWEDDIDDPSDSG